MVKTNTVAPQGTGMDSVAVDDRTDELAVALDDTVRTEVDGDA